MCLWQLKIGQCTVYMAHRIYYTHHAYLCTVSTHVNSLSSLSRASAARWSLGFFVPNHSPSTNKSPLNFDALQTAKPEFIFCSVEAR